MKRLPFVKMHGTGNDFIIIEHKTAKSSGRWTQSRVRTLCDRNTGIGGDGLIILTPRGYREYDFKIYNADGSSAETCINGIRCATLLVTHRDETVTFYPPAGPTQARAVRRSTSRARVEIDLGSPEYSAVSLKPLRRKGQRIELTGVAVGNPHVVAFVNDFSFNLDELAAGLQQHSPFPRGANIDFVRVKNERAADLRFFERGVGPTLSSGSGALASYYALRRADLVDNKVTMHTPGGRISVQYRPAKDRVYLVGPAKLVFRGEIVAS